MKIALDLNDQAADTIRTVIKTAGIVAVAFIYYKNN